MDYFRLQIIEAQDLKLIQAQILIDFQLEDNKHKEEEGKRAGEKEISCSILFLIVSVKSCFGSFLTCRFIFRDVIESCKNRENKTKLEEKES